MSHREEIRSRLEAIKVKDLNIVDWGSGSKPVFRYIKHDNCKFTNLDKNPETVSLYHDNGQELTVADIEGVSTFVDVEHDMAFCMEVLEHVRDPESVLINIHNSLKRGGKLILSVPFLFPIHGDEDYFRYTKHGLRYLLESVGFTLTKLESINNDEAYYVEAVT